MSQFTLPELSFGLDDLAPAMSRETLEYHWGKHHQSYVTNLNKLIEGTEFEGKSLEEIIKTAKGGVFNNAAQVFNHNFFWQCLKPNGGGEPRCEFLKSAINAKWGSFEEFRKAFTASAAGNFGSGWTWLVKKPDGTLDIVNTSNAANPLTEGYKPLLVLDVWEHAYYLKHQNLRADYIEDFCRLINWDDVERRYQEAMAS